MRNISRVVLIPNNPKVSLYSLSLSNRLYASTSILYTTSANFSTSASSSPTRVCIVGSGPSGFYTAKYLLKDDPNVQVDVLDRLPTPYGKLYIRVLYRIKINNWWNIVIVSFFFLNCQL